MPLNLNKCTLLRVTKKKSVLNFSCTIDGIQLKESSDVEYLGVTITGCLNWNTHVANVCAAARRALWSLRHKLPFAPPSVKLCAYKTLVRPVLESACVAWDPCTPKNMDELEKVQRLAVRFICNRYRRLDSPSDMINSLGLESLRARRKNMRLKFLYLMSNNYLNFDPSPYLEHATRRNTRFNHGRLFEPYQSANNIFKNSFFPRTIVDWNFFKKIHC